MEIKAEKNGDTITGRNKLVLVPLIAGGAAGTAVDVALFPIDTIKTRLQAKEGFLKAGGFRGVYNGLSAAAAGSAPGGALFFVAYEQFKNRGQLLVGGPEGSAAPIVHMTSASLAETVVCLIRVPTENVKQKMQTGQYSSFSEGVKHIFSSRGLFGFYTGYTTTVLREVPFSFIQFPLYEAFKRKWSVAQGRQVDPWQGACCGSLAGGIAGALTTPLDVVKTRLMTSKVETEAGMVGTLLKIYREEGLKKLFSGISARVSFICIGGFVFFGAYESVSSYSSLVFT